MSQLAVLGVPRFTEALVPDVPEKVFLSVINWIYLSLPGFTMSTSALYALQSFTGTFFASTKIFRSAYTVPFSRR